MKPHCILLYGNSLDPTLKYAGTFRIATELRLYRYDVQCIDISVFDKFDSEFEEIIKNFVTEKTLWVGISTTFLSNIFEFPYYATQKAFETQYASNPSVSIGIEKLVDVVKEKNPKVRFISGGPKKFMLEQFGFKDFKSNSDKEIIEFTKWCEGENKTPRLDFFSNSIRGSEFEKFSTSQIIYQPEDIITQDYVMPLEVSRGCIFKCKFCAFPMNGKTKGDWIKHTDVLKQELIRNYDQYGITNYQFSDDTYNDSADKVKLLHDEVFSKLPFKISFTSYLRLDLMIRFPDTVDYLVNSGLKSAVFGIETINHESGKSIGKGLDPKIQFQFIEELKKNQFKDILTYSGFIVGLPKDTEDYLNTLEEFLMSDKNKLDLCLINPLFINPAILNSNREAHSEFDLEYEKYGYKCWEDNGIKWSNDFTGLTFKMVQEFAIGMNKKIKRSSKFRAAGFMYSYWKMLGVSEQDLLTLSLLEIDKKYNIRGLIKKSSTQYKEQLLNFSKH
jgi:hypothetical protein